MKIKEKPNSAQFNVTEHELYGEKMLLVTPKHMGCEWTKDNLIFRSSLWTQDWQPISLGFKKFFNWGEKSIVCPEPLSIMDTVAPSKIDGSLCIVSKYKGNLIVRTRGTIDAKKMKNGVEIDFLASKYPRAFSNTLLNQEEYSLLYEWVSPNNQIVLRYPEPDIYFIGVVKHEDYSYYTQKKLDEYAIEIGVKRPKVYHFGDFNEMIASISELKDEEGICLYFNNGQDIKKIKSFDYLKKHAFKSNCTYKNVLSMWIDSEKPTLKDIENKIINDFDFECWQMAEENVKFILKHYSIVNSKIENVNKFVSPLKNLTRKEAALKILSAYKGTLYSGIAFGLLDNEAIQNDNLKKLIMEEADKENVVVNQTSFSVEEIG